MRKTHEVRALFVALLVYAVEFVNVKPERAKQALSDAKQALINCYNAVLTLLASLFDGIAQRMGNVGRCLYQRRIVKRRASLVDLLPPEAFAYKRVRPPEPVAMTLTLPEPVQTPENAPESLEMASPELVPYFKKTSGKRPRYFALSEPVAGGIYWYKIGKRYKRMVHPISFTMADVS